MPMPRIPPKRVPLRPEGKPMTADDIRELREQIASAVKSAEDVPDKD